jgi:hypothetical protein
MAISLSDCHFPQISQDSHFYVLHLQTQILLRDVCTKYLLALKSVEHTVDRNEYCHLSEGFVI